MLEHYKKSQLNVFNQFIIIDKEKIVIQNESLLFKDAIGKQINAVHPFFETVNFLSIKKNEEFYFKCVNINLKNQHHIIDITIKTFEKDTNSLIIIDDLTQHYNNLQKTTQIRNENLINSQLLKYKNQILKEKELFKNQFIRNFSHEIKIPVNSINRMCLLLENSNLSQNQLYTLNVITNINNQLKHILNDILDISKIETGYFKIRTSTFNICNIIGHIESMAKQKCLDKQLKFVSKIDKNCPNFIEGDQFRLTQILTNLIENAIKFTDSGTVKLEVIVKSKTENMVILNFKISDTGIGIEKKELDAIFNGFYQLKNNSIKYPGIGLGLAIVKYLLVALKGNITVESKLKEGSLFTIALPYKISKNQIPDKKLIREKKQSINARKILIADPFSKAKTEIETILNKKEYILNFVESGDEVIESLYRSNYDALIMNTKLPKMDGIETIRYIRLSEETSFKDIPVIMVSENAIDEKEVCIKNKANTFIKKPYSKDLLIEKIKSIIT